MRYVYPTQFLHIHHIHIIYIISTIPTAYIPRTPSHLHCVLCDAPKTIGAQYQPRHSVYVPVWHPKWDSQIVLNSCWIWTVGKKYAVWCDEVARPQYYSIRLMNDNNYIHIIIYSSVFVCVCERDESATSSVMRYIEEDFRVLRYYIYIICQPICADPTHKRAEVGREWN